MVLMCDGRAEEGENTVTGRLHDVAVVAVDRVYHQFKGWVDDAARILRVEILRQLGRAFDVSEQSSDCFAFTVERR
jgi:hypothetical protein